jgi:membrane-associated phospholipid phosphatase
MDGRADPASRAGAVHKVELGLLCAGLYGLVGSLALFVRNGSTPLRVDRVVTRLVDSVRLGDVVSATHAGGLWPHGAGSRLIGYTLPAAAAGLALGLAVLAGLRRDYRAAALCLLGPLLAVALTDSVLKPLVDRHHGRALAYPSGHATGAAAVAALLLLLFHRWRGWRVTAWLSPVALVLPVVMGLALVRLGFHYPTDVIGGTAMGVATVVALAVVLGAERATPPPTLSPD